MKKNKSNFIPTGSTVDKVKVYHSPGSSYPKLHINPECDAISQIPKEVLKDKTFSCVRKLAETRKGRTCRKCTLEEVLLSLLSDTNAKSKAFITFTSQAKPDNPDSNILTYNWSQTTDTGIARLEKLVANSDLELINTPLGPVAYGNVNYFAAKAISNNLRSIFRKGQLSLSKDEVLCAWVLINDNPPELAKILGEDFIDAISTAKNLLK